MTIRKSALKTQVKTMLRDRRLFFFLAVAAPFLLIGLWLAFDATVGVALLILGIALLAFSADKAVEYSVSIASALGISLFMPGLLIVSVYTDVLEKPYLCSGERKNTHRERGSKRGWLK